MRDFINRKNDLKDELPLQICIGFDPAESVACYVCCQSILENSARPVSFTPIGISDARATATYSRIVNPQLAHLVKQNELYCFPC